MGLFRQPVLGRRPLALRAMTVAAGVVGDEDMAALLASHHVSAERRRAAILNRQALHTEDKR